jgi:hypothetical protein
LSDEKLKVIAIADKIINEYAERGFVLTLRQLYYQFVARGLIRNSQVEYTRLGDAINDGRLCGFIDWEAIVDRTRNLKTLSHWDDPAQIVEACASQFRVDKWEGQTFRPEVWIEKDALVGVIQGVCEELDVPYFSCRGYTSQSEMWAAARRLHRYSKKGQTPIILHFGDHDPSGMDMTRDIQDRLELFMGGMEVRRLALNTDQVEQYTPPPNPAKISDTRAAAYIARFGDESWELDALDPTVLADLIRDTLTSLQDEDAWREAEENEERHKSLLSRASHRWDEIIGMLESE